MNPDTHVILVSGQPTPNITPVLDPELKPHEVIMVVSPDMRERADWLASVLQPAGVKITRWAIDDAYDVERVGEQILTLLAAREQQNIVLNVTGGTKPMAIAAYEVFRTAGKPIFYVHPEQDRLIWLSPRGLPARDLALRVKLKAFFQAHGAAMTERPASFGVPEHLRRVADGLIRHVEKYQRALPGLNWAAMTAEALVSPELPQSRWEQEDFKNLVGWFEAEGLLWRRGSRLQFADEQARFFVNGGWLEHYVYSVVQTVKRDGTIQDLGRSLVLSRVVDRERVQNELDVAFLADNRLFVIECKTRRFGEEMDDGSVGAESVYKLDRLTNLLGGLQARAMLVSYQSLPHTVARRAQDYRIETCAGAELHRLDHVIRRWIGS